MNYDDAIERLRKRILLKNHKPLETVHEQTSPTLSSVDNEDTKDTKGCIEG
jgi:hypothetical protein